MISSLVYDRSSLTAVSHSLNLVVKSRTIRSILPAFRVSGRPTSSFANCCEIVEPPPEPLLLKSNVFTMTRPMARGSIPEWV